MIHKIIITLSAPMNKTSLSHCYTIDKSDIMRVLTEDYRIVEYSSSKYVSDQNSEHKTYPLENFRDLVFSKTGGTMQHFFEFETIVKDGQEKGVTSVDEKKRIALAIFYGEHPLVKINGKTHKYTKNPVFNILDMALQTVEDVIDFDKELAVKTAISKMDLAELRDVCYYFGTSPKGKSEGELKVFLAGNNTGLLLKRTGENGQLANIDRFVKVFVENISAEDRDMKIVLRKAIELNVIQNNHKDNRDNYYLGTTPLGNSIDDMVAYFHKEEKLYVDFVKVGVEEKEDFTKEQTDSDQVEAAAKKGKMSDMSQAEVTSLRHEGKSLVKEGFLDSKTARPATCKIENLIVLVEKGRKAKAEAEAHKV